MAWLIPGRLNIHPMDVSLSDATTLGRKALNRNHIPTISTNKPKHRRMDGMGGRQMHTHDSRQRIDRCAQQHGVCELGVRPASPPSIHHP